LRHLPLKFISFFWPSYDFLKTGDEYGNEVPLRHLRTKKMPFSETRKKNQVTSKGKNKKNLRHLFFEKLTKFL
jgi:hypothetical protein